MALRKEGYWNEHYELELRNYEEDGDEGEVWFGKGLSRKITDWIVGDLRSRVDSQSRFVVDIGCGNAFIPCTLIDKLQSNNLSNNVSALGIDYSINSVNLSNKIVADRGLADLITIEQCDFLDQRQLEKVTRGEKYDFVVDKGTFDAICLMAEDEPDKLSETRRRYMLSLCSLLKGGSVIVLASCNYTQDELLSFIRTDCTEEFEIELVDQIETPKIQFGGKEGSQVTCLILRTTSDNGRGERPN